MADRKRLKRQLNIYKTLHKKNKDQITRIPLKTGVNSFSCTPDLFIL